MANADRLIEIFNQARALPSGEERDQFLATACPDPELKDQIISLLQSHATAGDFLEKTYPAPGTLRTEEPGVMIGRYRPLEPLGEGGCGVVYVAEQTEPVRRRVALKVIKLGMDTRQVVARFEAERQALAMMDHPNIAKVLDGGATDTGRPYFVMELVHGVRITDYCDQALLDTGQRLDLFIKVCQAIQHAHQKGIIHRDIKPSNILVTLLDGVPVPKVIDFGVAKAIEGRLSEATVYTRLHQFIGTPAYMSPEQVEMSGLDIDTRSDIYSLGVLLYELLTGRPPFDAHELDEAGMLSMRKTILEKEPVQPSTQLTQQLAAAAVPAGKSDAELGIPSPAEMHTDSRRRSRLKEQISRVRGDLDWIVMKCLEKDRSRRYETANGLAADIKRHLGSEPIVARPPSAAYKFQKAWRRNKLVFTAAAAVATALLLGTGVSTWLAFLANAEKITAQHDRYVARMNLAGAAWEQDNFDVVRQSLEDTRTLRDRGFEWYYWQRQTHLELKTLRGHLHDVTSVAFSPDGQRFVTGSADKTARMWDVASGQELFKLIGHKAWVSSVAFSLDGQRIVTASGDQTVRVWEAATGRELFKLMEHSGPVNAVAFSRDGQRIVTGSSDQTAKVWDVATQQVLVTLEGHTNQINSVAFSPDGQRIATGSHDWTARLWDAANGRELHKLIGHTTEIWSVAFSPDGQRIVTGGIDSIARIWDSASGVELPLLQLKGRGTMTSLAFSSDGKHIVTGSWNSTATLWDAFTGREELTIRGHVLGVLCVAFSPDGQRIVTGSDENGVKLWEASRERQPLTLQGNTSNIMAVAFSQDGQRIITGTGTPNVNGTVGGSGDQAAQVWDAASGKPLFTLKGHSSGISSVGFSPDGHRIVTGSGDQTARVWDAASGTELFKLTGRSPISSVAFSPDGQRVVAGFHDHTARVWDVVTSRELLLIGHTDRIGGVAFSRDGQRIVTGSDDRTVRVWEAATGREKRKIETPMRRILTVAFSPDGQRIAAGGFDRVAMLWERGADREPLNLRGHNGPVSSISFSRDGKRIVTGSYDSTAKVWELASGRELLTFKHSRPVSSAAFSPDGQRIVTGSYDSTAKVWEAARPDEVATWEEEERVAASSRVGWERELAALQRAHAAEEKRRRIALARGNEGAIKRWLILAPIKLGPGENGAQGLDLDQIKGEGRLRPKAGERVVVGSGELNWQVLAAEDYAIDFNAISGVETKRSVAYAVCYIRSDGEQRGLQMLLGSDDEAKVYLNGNQIYNHSLPRTFFADQQRVPDIQLNAGLNVLVFKVVNEGAEWEGSIRLSDAQGNPVQGIHVTLDPEAKDAP